MSYKVINGELVSVRKYRSRYSRPYSKEADRSINQEWSKDYRESARRSRKQK